MQQCNKNIMKKILPVFLGLFGLLMANTVRAQRDSATLKPDRYRNAATANLKGTITDSKTGKPVEGVTIYIPDLKLGTLTNAAGEYEFKNLPRGSYLLEIKSLGYKAVSNSVVFSKDASYDFKLSESYAEGNEVVVTGLSKATQVKRSPVPIVSVSHDYLVTNLNTNAIDAIAKIPGVRAVTTGPNVSKPFIRGLGYNRILTLYDGIRQEGQQWGDEHGIEVDQYGVERVEVIKGPASLSYGSDALAGVVNLIPTQAAPEGKIIGDVTADYQTNNRYIGGSAMLSGTKNGIEWMGRFSHKMATNYQNKYDGRVFGTAFRETDASASIGIHRKWGYSHLNLVLFDDQQEIPDGSRDSATRKFTRQIYDGDADTVRQIVSDADLKSYTIEHLHQRVQHYRAFLSNSFILGAGRLEANLGFQRSIRREFSHPVLYDIPGLYLQLNSYTYDFKYYFPEWDNWNITAGVNGMYQDNNSTKGTEFIIPSYHQFDIGPFILAKKSFGKLDVAGGIRYDVRSFKNFQLLTKQNPVTGFDEAVGPGITDADTAFHNYSKTFSGISGSLGATYNFTEQFSMKLNISRGFRAPNIAEISSHGVHPGTNMYQMGNPNFKPEFSLQEDLGFLYSSKYVVATMNVFLNDISNYIYNQKLLNPDGTDVIMQGQPAYQFQASRARLYGGEASVDLHPVKNLHFENSFSVVYANNRGAKGKSVGDTAKYLPFIPPAHGIAELRLDFSNKSLHLVKGFVKAQLEYYSSQNRVFSAFGTETRTPGYTLVNAGVGGTFTNKQGKSLFSVYILANNLFDIAYQDHLSRLKYMEPYPGNFTGRNGMYNMGRNISFKIDFPLDFKM